MPGGCNQKKLTTGRINAGKNRALAHYTLFVAMELI